MTDDGLSAGLRQELGVYVLAGATPRDAPVLVPRRHEEQGFPFHRPDCERNAADSGFAVYAHQLDVRQRCRPDIGFLELRRVTSALLEVISHCLGGLPAGGLRFDHPCANDFFIAAGAQPKPADNCKKTGRFHSLFRWVTADCLMPDGRLIARISTHCYSRVAPDSLTTCAHRADSDLTKAANSARVLGDASTPCSSRRCFRSGAARAFIMTPWSRSTIAPDVATGTATPCHTVTSKSGMPDSILVGTSGTCTARSAEVTASGRTRPALISGSCPGRLANIAWCWPLMRSR